MNQQVQVTLVTLIVSECEMAFSREMNIVFWLFTGSSVDLKTDISPHVIFQIVPLGGSTQERPSSGMTRRPSMVTLATFLNLTL